MANEEKPDKGLSYRQAAAFLAEKGIEISPKGINLWVQKGLIKLNEHGRLDPEYLEAQALLARRRQSPIHGGKRVPGQPGAHHAPPAGAPAPDVAAPNGKPPDLQSIVAADKALDVQIKKHKLAEIESRLCEVAKVQRALTDLGGLTGNMLERIPDRVRVPMTPEQIQDLRRVVRDAMTELADEAERLARKILSEAA